MEQNSSFLLQEFKVELENLTPTVPDKIKQEAKEKLNELKDSEITEQKVETAMAEVGKKTYPHRKAFQILAKDVEVSSETKLALEKLSDDIANQIKQVLPQGEKIHAVTKTEEFEEAFEPEEKHEINHAILQAEDQREEKLANKILEKQEKYEQKVQEYKERMEKIEQKIQQIKKLADKSNKWHQEITDEVQNMEAGWSLVEPDPDLEKISKRLEHWQTKVEQE
jgi:hypothetical protein